MIVLGIDTSAAAASAAVLTGAGLTGAGLSGAVLSGAGLSGAGLSGAGLSGAGLSGAGLSGAVLSGAGLSGAGLSGAGLSGAGLSGDRIAVASADLPRAHGAVLPGLIISAARSAGVTLDAVTHVAVARGPGLFTGMRVGLVSAEMFALARGIPLAGVSTLDAFALRVVQRFAPASDFAVCVDARRREAFVQVFDGSGRPLDEPRAVDAVRWMGLPGIPDDALYVDSAAAGYGVPGIGVPVGGLAAEVAALAARRWRAGAGSEPATPLYLRRPDTTAPNPARSVLGLP